MKNEERVQNNVAYSPSTPAAAIAATKPKTRLATSDERAIVVSLLLLLLLRVRATTVRLLRDGDARAKSPKPRGRGFVILAMSFARRISKPRTRVVPGAIARDGKSAIPDGRCDGHAGYGSRQLSAGAVLRSRVTPETIRGGPFSKVL